MGRTGYCQDCVEIMSNVAYQLNAECAFSGSGSLRASCCDLLLEILKEEEALDSRLLMWLE